MRSYSGIKAILWNVALITIGSFIYALGIKAIAFPHDLVAGGLFGLGLLVHYVFGGLDPSAYFLLFNLPLFVAGYLLVSKRFILYTLLAVVLTTVFFQVINIELPVESSLYAALAAGFISGAGVGIVLRSLGSGGGLDIIAVYLHNRWGISFGRFSLSFHIILYGLCFAFLDVDRCITSIIMAAVAALVMDEVVSTFSRRRVVQILSDSNEKIAGDILKKLHRGCTYIKARGAYSGKDRDILMTVINPVQLKRLEDIVFNVDPDALFIVENTYTVLGKTFSKRKKY